MPVPSIFPIRPPSGGLALGNRTLFIAHRTSNPSRIRPRPNARHALPAGSYGRTRCKGMLIPATSTSAPTDFARAPAVVRPRDARTDDADHRPGERQRSSRNRPAERVVRQVYSLPATDASSNRDNSRGTRLECAANATRRGCSRGPDTPVEWSRSHVRHKGFAMVILAP